MYTSHAWSVSYYTNRPVTWQFLYYDCEEMYSSNDWSQIYAWTITKILRPGGAIFILVPPIYNLYWTTNFHNRQLVHTYLAASIVWSLLVLSSVHNGKALWQVSPRRHQGQCWPSSLPVQYTSPTQWMTVAWSPVAWSLGHQAYPPPPPSSPPLPSPFSHSSQWEWGLRERHKQKGRTINNTVFIPVHQLLHSMPTQQVHTVFWIPSSIPQYVTCGTLFF